MKKQKLIKSLSYFITLFAVLGMPFSPYAFAQSSEQKELNRLEKERKTRENRIGILEKNAQSAQNEIEALRQKLINAALNQRLAEQTAEKSENRLIILRAQEKNATLEFAQKKEALEAVVAALIAVEKERPPALAIKPNNATEAARVAILMRLVAPRLDEKARQISGEIVKLRKVRQDLLMGNEQYRNATINLVNSRKTVAILISQRQSLISKLQKDANAERDVIAQIAQKSSGLRDLIAKLGEALPQINKDNNGGPSFASGFAKAKGKILPPSNGILVQKFGETLSEGGAATGITIRTRQSAQVLAPYDGKVEFAAPFRAYGRVLIINVGDKYRIVLAGMGATYVEAGQEILAGEPIGEMSQDSRIIPDLYMEIRYENATLNPSEWLMKI